jgi:tRNA-2-methylthio-N6-dimethylallyladenosine synthase
MRRSYRSGRFLGILDRVRAAIPEAAITTDVIVGFPGETERDFVDTLDVVARSRFAGAFTFQYSPRPGTPAAARTDQVDPDVVQERYERLVTLQDDISFAANTELVGRRVEVLLAAGQGRKDAGTGRVSGRARDNRLVHLDPVGADPVGADPVGADPVDDLAGWAPGALVEGVVTRGAPHHLLAGQARLLRPGASSAPVPVLLGMPVAAAGR